MRELLIRLAIKYNGNYFKIRKALSRQEIPENCDLQPALTIVDEDYPRSLLELKYPPFVLFYSGNKKLLEERKIAVVGSRKAGSYGIAATEYLVKRIKNRYVIISGMAKGIDAVAHLNAEKTIGVLGNGLDVTYPKENSVLYQKMKETQLLISEYPAGTGPAKEHFPFRNRIMAALAEKLIVTQAAERSGTMHTVNEALDLGKEIYVVPYRLNDPDGIGCNRLIEQGANIICV